MKEYVYCSGPLFSPEERDTMKAISDCLEDAGYGTFLPQRDGVEAHVMKMVNSPLNINFFNIRKHIDRAIFSLDIYQLIERCDYILFNMNGRVPDEGGLIEAAVAWTAGTPLLVYKNDDRTAFKGKDNSMITGLVETRKVSEIEKIPAELESLKKKRGEKEDYSYSPEFMPPHMRDAVEYGRKVWNILEKLRGTSGGAQDS